MLKQKYTPEQLAALEAGEEAIDPADIASQGVLRNDPMALKYLDDFSQIRPVVDKPVRAPETNYDPHLRFKEDDEIAEDLASFAESLGTSLTGQGDGDEAGDGAALSTATTDPDPAEFDRWVDNLRLTVGLEAAEKNPRSYEAPPLPKIQDRLVRQQARLSRADANADEMAPHYARLSRQTGMPVETMKALRSKNLVMHRVVNQTRMGKVQSLYFLTVAGNGRGLLGLGEGKAAEPNDARRQALLNAMRNLVPVRRYEERTIFGDVTARVGGTVVGLYSRPPGKFLSACFWLTVCFYICPVGICFYVLDQCHATMSSPWYSVLTKAILNGLASCFLAFFLFSTSCSSHSSPFIILSPLLFSSCLFPLLFPLIICPLLSSSLLFLLFLPSSLPLPFVTSFPPLSIPPSPLPFLRLSSTH